MIEFIRSLLKRLPWILEDWRAKKRGEVRIAPHGATGRIYARREDDAVGGKMNIQTEGMITISARKFNSATGMWEDLGDIGQGTIKRR